MLPQPRVSLRGHMPPRSEPLAAGRDSLSTPDLVLPIVPAVGTIGLGPADLSAFPLEQGSVVLAALPERVAGRDAPEAGFFGVRGESVPGHPCEPCQQQPRSETTYNTTWTGLRGLRRGWSWVCLPLLSRSMPQ